MAGVLEKFKNGKNDLHNLAVKADEAATTMKDLTTKMDAILKGLADATADKQTSSSTAKGSNSNTGNQNGATQNGPLIIEIRTPDTGKTMPTENAETNDFVLFGRMLGIQLQRVSLIDENHAKLAEEAKIKLNDILQKLVEQTYSNDKKK